MQLTTKTLVAVAKATAVFMAVRDVRYSLNGAHLIKKGSKLTIETTDGHRGAQVRINCDEDGPDFDVIVGRESWLAISKIKTTKMDNSKVSLLVLSDGATLTLANGATLPLDFVDGEFPDVNRVLRAAPSKKAEPQITVGVNAVYASEAFKAAAILANPKYRGAMLTVTSPNHVLTIEAPTDHGEFHGLNEPAVFVVMPLRV